MELMIITGMSGSGKTRAIAAMEDMGFYCIDNMPPSLVPRFAEMCYQSGGKISKVALIVDARGANMLDKFFEGIGELKKAGFIYKLLFLDTQDEKLVARYKESRRRHPLADNFGGSVSKAIKAEREMLAGLKECADYIIDTTNLSPAQLKDYLYDLITGGKKHSLLITVNSFGYKYGMPIDADLVFDVRCFPNPFYIKELKSRTGLDTEVKNYVFSFPETNLFMEKLNDMMKFMIPLYTEEGKTSLTISIGCTGGKHRSVAIAEALGAYLNENVGHCIVSHRDITKK